MQFISSLLLCFCHCIIPTYLRQLLNAVVCGPRPQLLCAGDRMSVCAHPRRVAGEIPNLFVSVLSFSTAPCSHICHSCHCHHHHHHCHHHTNAVMPSVGVFIAVICLLGSHFRQRHPGWIWLSHQQRHQLQVSKIDLSQERCNNNGLHTGTKAFLSISSFVCTVQRLT